MSTKQLRLLIISAAALVALTVLIALLPGPADPPAAPSGEPVGSLPAADTAATTVPAAPPPETARPVTEPQAIADYLFTHGSLPANFMTRREAEALGYHADRNFLSDVAPGMSIGGDRFGNYEGLLPKAAARTWKECDANYVSGPRGTERIVFSSDGLIYYTADLYETFTQLFPTR